MYIADNNKVLIYYVSLLHSNTEIIMVFMLLWEYVSY